MASDPIRVIVKYTRRIHLFCTKVEYMLEMIFQKVPDLAEIVLVEMDDNEKELAKGPVMSIEYGVSIAPFKQLIFIYVEKDGNRVRREDLEKFVIVRAGR